MEERLQRLRGRVADEGRRASDSRQGEKPCRKLALVSWRGHHPSREARPRQCRRREDMGQRNLVAGPEDGQGQDRVPRRSRADRASRPAWRSRGRRVRDRHADGRLRAVVAGESEALHAGHRGLCEGRDARRPQGGTLRCEDAQVRGRQVPAERHRAQVQGRVPPPRSRALGRGV